ncbi:DUF2812 domain-containing protein [Ferdinandcohnia sp. Marseille-Q9671]
MSKTIYKLRPSDYWRIGEHENWFQDMAAQGYHLKKMGIHFAKFSMGEPKKMKYRIDVSMKRKLSTEKKEMYKESGWDFVTGYQYFQVYSSPVEREAPELHSDAAEQSYTLKELDKKLALNAGIVGVGVLIMLGMLASLWFLDGTPTYMLVEGAALQQTLLTVIIGYLAYMSLQAAISIRALRKTLIEGKPIDHHAPWKKHHRIHTTISFLFTLFAGLSAILPFIHLVKMDTQTLPLEPTNLPIVRLADVEQNPALVRGEPEYMSDNVDWGNRYSTMWSPFAPVQYDTDEQGIVPGETWEDGSGEYSPQIHTRVFKLSIPSMADNLISDLIKRYTYENQPESFNEVKHPTFDHLLVYEEEEMKKVYASKGKAVIYVQYNGFADMDVVIEEIEKKVKMISE